LLIHSYSSPEMERTLVLTLLISEQISLAFPLVTPFQLVLLDLNPDHDLITRDGFEYQGEAHKAFPK